MRTEIRKRQIENVKMMNTVEEKGGWDEKEIQRDDLNSFLKKTYEDRNEKKMSISSSYCSLLLRFY